MPQRVIISEYDERGNPTYSLLKKNKTIQTHNAQNIVISGNHTGSFFDCDGYSDIAVTLLNDASTSNTLNLIWSNDEITDHGFETILSAASSQKRAGNTSVKARYCKIQVVNGDGTAAHVISTWAYLKA